MSLTIKGAPFYFGIEAESERVSFENFYQWLTTQESDAQWPYVHREGEVQVRHNLYCNMDDTHFFGVFLSARNTEFRHFVRRDGDRVIVEARSTEGSPPVEMNFFCIRKDSNKGIFAHYLGSYRFQKFLHDLWITYKDFVKQQKDCHLNNLEEGDTKARTASLYSLRGRRCISPLYTPGTFSQLIDRLDVIDEVRFTSYEVDAPDDQPVSSKLKSVHKVYRLEEQAVNSGVKQWLTNLRNNSAKHLQSGRTSHSGSIVGKEASGADLMVSFENTMEDYLEYDYDALGTFEVNNIKSHTLVREMVLQMNNNLLFSPARVD